MLENEIGPRAKAIRDSVGYTATQMAVAVGLKNRKSWEDYERGKHLPTGAVLLRLASMGFNTDWFFTGRGTMRGESSLGTEPDLAIDSASKATKGGQPALGEDFILLPRYEVKAAAGAGMVVYSEKIVDHLAFKATWIRNTLRRSPASLILIEAQGDSMEPTISDGDLLLVDTAEHKVKDYAIYVFSLNGDLLVKRVQRKMSGDLVISSDNEKYKPDYVQASAANDLNVVGQVVWHGGAV